MISVGSCFAGIGGFDLAFEASGRFRTVWHSEVSPAASRVLAHRFPAAAPLGDIEALTCGLFPPPKTTVITGGPPCQDLSIANTVRRGLAGVKSGLFLAWVDVIAQAEPEWIVMEQVTGLLTSNGGADWATVQLSLRGLGYEIDVVVVNSLRYTPQTRERLIVVGSRVPGAATRALLPLIEDGARHPGQGRPTRRRPAVDLEGGAVCYRKSRRPATNTDGESWVGTDYANTLTLFDAGSVRATVIVLDRDGRPRIMTPEEWEGCQGFPDGWTVAAGSDLARWAALGNAVSPPVAQRVAEGILSVIDGLCEECGDTAPAFGHPVCLDCLD